MHIFIMDMMNSFGYIGIALLIMIENLFPPIPSEVILTFGGFMTTYTHLTVGGVVFFSTLGSTVGAIFLYYIGKVLSPEKLEQLIDGKLGKILHFKKSDVRKSIKKFQQKGNMTVFICRCIPILRSLISIPAGMSNMKMGNFLVLTIAGSALWNTILVSAGAAAGASWEKILEVMDTYSTVVIIIIGLSMFFGCFFYYRNRKMNRKARKGLFSYLSKVPFFTASSPYFLRITSNALSNF